MLAKGPNRGGGGGLQSGAHGLTVIKDGNTPNHSPVCFDKRKKDKKGEMKEARGTAEEKKSGA